MTYEVRRPNESDAPALDKLLDDDYRRNGIDDKPPLTPRQLERYAREAWVAVSEEERLEALVLAGKWNYKLATPYSRLPERALRVLGRTGAYDRHTGIYILSAVDYEEGGALSSLVDATEVLEPTEGPVHVPLLRTEIADRAFLLGRGFEEGKEGHDDLTWRPNGPKVETVLMTRKKQ